MYRRVLQAPRSQRQPPVDRPVDWDSKDARNLTAIYSGGRKVWTPNGPIEPFYHSVASTQAAHVSGRGAPFDGGVAQAIGWDLNRTVAAADAVSIEVLVQLSNAPSLSTLAVLSTEARSDGIVNPVLDDGRMRGAMAYTGADPCDIYAWGGNMDFDTDVPMLASHAVQHLVLTKVQGTGAVPWKVYRNGVPIASGNNSNGTAWVTSGPYFYIGGRHYAGASSIVGIIFKAALYDTELSAGRVAEIYRRLWAAIKRRVLVPVSSGPPAPPPVGTLGQFDPGLRITGWF